MSAREALITHAGDAGKALSEFPGLAETIHAMLTEARGAWPTVNIPDDVFLRHLGEKLAGEADPISALVSTHGSDLYLACACLHGDAQAVMQFERHFMSEVEAFLRFPGGQREFPDDIKQTLSVRLLTADGPSGPRIGQYSGQGPLGGWLRMAAVRAGIDSVRSDTAQRKSETSSPFANPVGGGRNPELRYLQSHYRAEFEEVFKNILEGLTRRERNLLRMYYLDSVPTEALGTLYGVTDRTIRRWVDRINKRILRLTVERLRERLEISTTDLGALMALVESQLDLSISRFLRKHGDG